MAKSSMGQFIAALRKANGMTQQEVADRLAVSNKAVSRWERDECAPDISLIPALAEMFGVTCDELLKGERILDPSPQEKKELKVEKQIKNLINRTLSGFTTRIWISLAISIVGLVCMFGISYGFYRPVIGFAVMLVFEACAFVLTVLAVNRTKGVKADNELFEEADNALIAKFNSALGSLSFRALFVIASVVLLSLPFILFASDYAESVITLQSYFTIFFGGIVLMLALVFLKLRKPYMEWITDNRLLKKTYPPIMRKVHMMTAVQVGLTFLAGLIFAAAPFLEANPTDKFSLFDVGILVGIFCLAANIICFIVFLVKHKEGRKKLLLPGIRNVFLILPALLVIKTRYMGWQGNGGEGKYIVWQTEYLWFSFMLVILILVIFSLIDVLIKRKSK